MSGVQCMCLHLSPSGSCDAAKLHAPCRSGLHNYWQLMLGFGVLKRLKGLARPGIVSKYVFIPLVLMHMVGVQSLVAPCK
jgi:hypothetical protein